VRKRLQNVTAVVSRQLQFVYHYEKNKLKWMIAILLLSSFFRLAVILSC